MKAHTHCKGTNHTQTSMTAATSQTIHLQWQGTKLKLKSQLQPQQTYHCVCSPQGGVSWKGERHKSRERSECSQTKPPFTLMAGLLNACVHSGLFLVVSGRLRVLELTVSSRFWDQFFRSKGTDVAQRRMWIPVMDHCLGLGSGCVCVCVSFCVHVCIYLYECFHAGPCRRSRTRSSCMCVFTNKHAQWEQWTCVLARTQTHTHLDAVKKTTTTKKQKKHHFMTLSVNITWYKRLLSRSALIFMCCPIKTTLLQFWLPDSLLPVYYQIKTFNFITFSAVLSISGFGLQNMMKYKAIMLPLICPQSAFVITCNSCWINTRTGTSNVYGSNLFKSACGTESH